MLSILFSLRIFDDDVDLNVIAASDPTKTLEDELPDEEPTVAEVNTGSLFL